ncbi:MAG: hypothetical protein KER_03064 [Kerstersia gyiorum]|uniref:hypothetical protein n=1 Tax=Kerstersia gyiorum TaxID=206506 RepID=UPI0030D42864
MSKMPWFRMYTDFLNDPKMIALAFEDQRHFIGILALKSDGALDQNCTPDLLDRIVAQRLWIDHAIIRDVKKRLVAAGLIDDSWSPLAWERRQMRSDSSAERTRKYREKLKAADGDASVTSRERSSDALDTDTDKEEEKKTTTARARSAAPAKSHTAADLVALGVDEDVAAEFLAIRKRKRAALTPLALAGIQREAGKAGWTLNDALRKAVERGWQSVEAAWLLRDTAPQRQTGTGQFDPLAYVNRNRTSRHQGDSNVIDV